MVIAFLGVDGSGKSTIINSLKDLNLPFCKFYYFHLKPRVIRLNKKNDAVTNPHSKAEYNGTISYIKLVHFIMTYWLGFLINFLPFTEKNSLIIFDRYYDDIYIDPKRFRYGGSVDFAKFMKLFIPKPDITFVLTTSPEIIIKRKQEISFKELIRQIGEYQKIKGKNIIQIDVNASIEEISQQVQKIIFEKLSDKY